MSGKDKQREDRELEITAQPKSLGEELAAQAGHEQGLSVDAEDLGRTWLSDATEQGNFESARGGESDEIWASSAAPSDEPLPGPNFEVDKDVWENTVSLMLQHGEGAVSDPYVEDDDRATDDGLHAIADREAADIDLTQNSIQEASLFDHEAAELGETEGPHTVITEDGHTHARHPGVHPSPPRSQGELPLAAAPAKSAGRAASSKAGSAAKAPAKSSKTLRPPTKKPSPSKPSKPRAARSSAPRAR